MSEITIWSLVLSGLAVVGIIIVWLRSRPPSENCNRPPHHCWTRAHEGSCNCERDEQDNCLEKWEVSPRAQEVSGGSACGYCGGAMTFDRRAYLSSDHSSGEWICYNAGCSMYGR